MIAAPVLLHYHFAVGATLEPVLPLISFGVLIVAPPLVEHLVALHAVQLFANFALNFGNAGFENTITLFFFADFHFGVGQDFTVPMDLF